MNQKRVLVISAHTGEMDRRIIAEANTLAESGRAVTLVSVPTGVPEHCLHPQVRLVMPAVDTQTHPKRRAAWLRSLVRASLLRTLGPLLRPIIWSRQLRARERYFLEQTPRGDYDVIHCHDLDTLPAACALRTQVAPAAKIVYDAHELFPYQIADRTFERFWARIEKQYIHVPEGVITVNGSLADQLAEMYGIARPAVIFNSYGNPHNEAPLSAAAFFEHFRVPPGGFRVLFQGSLSPLRNLPNLMRAFGLLDASYRLFILGSGPLERQRCATFALGMASATSRSAATFRKRSCCATPPTRTWVLFPMKTPGCSTCVIARRTSSSSSLRRRCRSARVNCRSCLGW